jgi:hypothetical protein
MMQKGSTPLTYAFSKGTLESLSVLLTSGATCSSLTEDQQVKDAKQKTILLALHGIPVTNSTVAWSKLMYELSLITAAIRTAVEETVQFELPKSKADTNLGELVEIPIENTVFYGHKLFLKSRGFEWR